MTQTARLLRRPVGPLRLAAPLHSQSVLVLALLAAACAEAPPVPTADQRTAALRGTLAFEGSGRPAAAVRVRLWLAGGGVQDSASDEQGAFEMTLLEPGAARVAWCGGGADSGAGEGPIALRAGERALLKLSLKPATSATAPCDAFFAAAAAGPPPRAWARPPSREPQQPVRPIKSAPPAKELPAGVTGVVADARGTAVGAARVQLRRAGEELVIRETATGEGGKYELKPLAAGRYDVEVQAPGASAEVRGLWLGPGRTRELPFRFGARRGAIRVSGTVKGPDGAPAAGVRVGAQGDAADGAGARSTPEAVHTGADGRFTLSVVETPGPVLLFASSADGALAATAQLIRADADAEVDLALKAIPARASCAGRVLLEGGAPAAGATITAAGSRSLPPREGVAVAAADGSFRLACPGQSAVLRATLGAAGALAEVAAPAAGVELHLAPAATLRLRPSFREPVKRVVARVLPLDDEGAPAAGAQAAEQLVRRGESEGEPLEIGGLPIGRPVDVSLVADDGRMVEGSVVLPGAGVWEVELPF